jgi:hypothetical protein
MSAKTSRIFKCLSDFKLELIDGFKMDIIDLQYTAFKTNITEFTDDGM